MLGYALAVLAIALLIAPSVPAAAKKTAAQSKASSTKKAPAKKSTTSASKKSSASKKTATAKKAAPKRKSASRKSTSTRRRAATTWRNRQMQPTAQRYQEIQEALAAKGYLQAPATGVWGPQSIEALRSFQRDQHLEPSGKIDSVSLIALGLGPKHDSATNTSPLPSTAAPEQ